MDVDKFAFQARLLDILLAVGEANFVSFDLELSGVPVTRPGEARGKPSLQDRYTETKHAAEKFQILQIGLTCVREEDDRGVYLCKPYNFNLSPIVEEKRLDIDRTFSFHSGAVEFLLSVGFEMNLPFISGVPYLSRSEAKLAEQKAVTRSDRSAIADIHIKPEDIQSIAFLRRVRNEIDAWRKADHQLLVITPVKENGVPVESELSRFERRLVHQLVRAEYQDLVTVPSRGMIRIVKFDQEREDRIKAERLREAKERIDRQTGFRWVIEAMAGNPPYHMQARQFAASLETGEPIAVNLDEIDQKLRRARYLLSKKKTVLVGHNMFLDLIYLYNTFIGPLPDSVDDFINLIHEIFPLVIDTKYVATHNCGDINPRSSLEEIAEQLSLQEYPVLETHQDHDKYNDTTAFHEAGYDSLLTAQVAVRLSTKLEAAGTYIADNSEGDLSDEPGGVKLNVAAADFTPGDKSPPLRAVSTLSSALGGLKDLVTNPLKALTGEVGTSDQPGSSPGISLDGQVDTSVSGKMKKQKKKKKNNPKQAWEKSPPQTQASLPSRFAHPTAFDQLRDLARESDEEDVIQFDDLPISAPASAPVVADTDGVSEGGVVAPEDWNTPYWRREAGRAMPRFDSDFWAVYGNKLRVFGTEEGVCLLDK